MRGKAVEIEAVEGRPPKTIEVPDEKGGTCRYGLADWSQEGDDGRIHLSLRSRTRLTRVAA